MNGITKEILNELRATYTKGTRVELVAMSNEPNVANGVMGPGSLGTVKHVDDMGSIHISWDCGSGIAALYGEDVVKIVKEKEDLVAKTHADLEAVIERLKANGTINLIEYTVAREVLFEATENNSLISESNNIGKEFVDHPEKLVAGLKNACAAFKTEHPDSINWEASQIESNISGYSDYCF